MTIKTKLRHEIGRNTICDHSVGRIQFLILDENPCKTPIAMKADARFNMNRKAWPHKHKADHVRRNIHET